MRLLDLMAGQSNSSHFYFMVCKHLEGERKGYNVKDYKEEYAISSSPQQWIPVSDSERRENERFLKSFFQK